ncbi:MAG: DJ-1/PfpI family protein [Ignavibacteria bacterium]|nr:DJ-1/PfpI family protein [Ignavibacteria bacterium]MBK7252792.1 DJ-1/PfpI family protein [Ignavibacteria bacterium]MBK8383584.1 DJ-1/PfpI family protein [Ignavibacteria bacterium]MBK9403409.1 DJ-1/PfpI family protein [Ignavibacteria bacterium]MBL0108603.1 DJ-1/PfpI family protein [Ignavibacteria bacterium]
MKKTKFVFLVLPHIHLMDLAGPDQVFLEAAGYNAPFEIEYCSTEKSLSSSAKLPIGKLNHFSKIKIEENDFLLIPGAELNYLLSDEFKTNKSLFSWIRNCRDKKIKICSICSGAFVLAESGVLEGKECTTHWKRTKELQQLYPDIKVIENVLFTEDDNIYTSAGIASGIDMALYIVEQMKGEYFAHKVARELVIYSRRSGNQKQQSELLNFRNHIHSGIHKVQDWLQINLDKKASLTELAEIACMSDRNLTRIFKKETSLTVNQYITLLRKEKIGQLSKNPDNSRSIIAKQCGLKSEKQISRIIKKK